MSLNLQRSDRCRIVVDTCCDFSPEIAANLDVDILGFPYILNGEEHTDDIWNSITPKQFYDQMREGATVSTSAVSLGRYVEFFTECAKEGTPTVYFCFTSALSSSYNSACQAAEAVRADNPDFELYVVDNALPCACGELLAIEAVRQRAAGLTAKQLVDWANEAKTYVHGYFTLENFDALAAGGRIPPAAASSRANSTSSPSFRLTWRVLSRSSVSTAAARRPLNRLSNRSMRIMSPMRQCPSPS